MDLGPYHPITVHFPVALITFALVLDALRVFTKYRPFFVIGHWTVIIGTILLVPPIITGLDAAASKDPFDLYISLHKNMAFATLGFSLFHSSIRGYALMRYYKELPRKLHARWFLVVSTINMLLVSITGDLGGFLTHGSTPFIGARAAEEEVGKDPYNVRFFKPEELKDYLTKEITLNEVYPIFEKHSCRNCHVAQFFGENLEGFSTPDDGREAWLARNEEGAVENWEASPFYQSVILKNEMPMNENNQIIGMPERDRLILLLWLLNGAPLEQKKEAPEENEDDLESDDWLD